jgi:transcription elongation factor GreA
MDMANKDQVFELTKEGYEEVIKELDRRTNVERPKILQAISEARANGDLSENADYSAAREAQSENEARITELENIVKYHKIIEDTTITIKYVDLNKEYTLKIVGSSEANPKEGKISKESPLGKAIMNRKVNETFTFISESGRELKVKLLKKN